MKRLLRPLAAILICEAVGIIGSVFTISSIPTWYAGLNKPWFSPPNWLFGPVWTILYALMGLSAAIIWTKENGTTARKLFVGQLVLNSIWSPLFFGAQSPGLGLIIIIAMWIMILATTKAFFKLSKTAGIMLLPYIAWVSFATILNAAIVILN